MSALIRGSLSCGQFELLTGTMFLPLKVTSSIACGSWKSAIQPLFGQIFGSCLGTLQKRVNIVACVTEIVRTRIPIRARLFATTLAVSDPGGVLSATWATVGPEKRPLGNPACLSIC